MHKCPAIAKSVSGITPKAGALPPKTDYKHLVSDRGQNFYFKHASNRDLKDVKVDQKPKQDIKPTTG